MPANWSGMLNGPTLKIDATKTRKPDMNDSYTRNACGIRTVAATRASRTVDAILLVAGWAVALAPIATFIF